MSKRYAIKSLDEAKAYLAHPVLGRRLVEICEAALAVEGKSAREVFGSPDDMKLRSCATLFASVSPPDSVFDRILDKYFEGQRDDKTLSSSGASEPAESDPRMDKLIALIGLIPNTSAILRVKLALAGVGAMIAGRGHGDRRIGHPGSR